MMRTLARLFNKNTPLRSIQDPQKLYEYSINKYAETYKLLEEYDRKTKRASEVLARPGPLRTLVQENK